MSYSTLLTETDAHGVTTVTLNRPEKRNALSAQMIQDLTDVAAQLSEFDGTRVVVLRGAGAVFCGGGDLNWMRAQINADRATRMAEARKLAHMFKALNEMPVPLIGQIHGAAMGGAVGLACVCDVAVASENTQFGLTETRLGLIPATIGPYVVARLGEGATRRIAMSSRIFDGAEAKALGIVADVVPEDALEARVQAEVAPYLNVGPRAVAAAKQMVRRLGAQVTEADIEASVTALADIWEGAEAAEGIAAFLEKRSAIWG